MRALVHNPARSARRPSHFQPNRLTQAVNNSQLPLFTTNVITFPLESSGRSPFPPRSSMLNLMATPASFAGRIVGNYRLIERIGEGGMGEVYSAERTDSFRKRVAVKLIRAGMAKPEVVRRFVIERQTLAALNHPNIVRLVDGGAT